jgi:hypothetical protein
MMLGNWNKEYFSVILLSIVSSDFMAVDPAAFSAAISSGESLLGYASAMLCLLTGPPDQLTVVPIV